ncbi:MAG: LCP family protein [Clostridia bacterium]|nr:LCP family protein [Clostridia bacterium]
MKKKKRGAILISLMLIFALCIGGVFFAATHYLGKINRVGDIEPIPAEEEFFDTDDADPSLEVVDPDSIIWDNAATRNDEDLINILLVGQDKRPGQGRQRSDSMILCSFNPETNRLSMISFLRDLYVQIPGYSDNRLNAAYVFGGFPLLKSALNTNFGVTVDGCVEVDFNGFKNVIDTIGGVDIELTEAEAKIIGDGAKAGKSHLDGEHALMYARIRKIDSDFGRTERQRNVLNAVFSRLKNSSVSELLGLVDTVLPMITTDMTNVQITSLAVKYAPALVDLKISTYHVPANGSYKNAMVRGMAVLVPDLAKVKEAIFEDYLPLD